MTGDVNVDINEDNVKADTADTAPWNNVFLVAAEDSPDFTRSGNNKTFNASGFQIEFHVADKADAFAVTQIDNFLLT